MARLDGRTAVVTGGGGGLGRAISIALSAAGASIGVLDISLERAQQTVDEISAQGGKGVAVHTDVRSEDSASAALAAVADALGPVDVLVNNAAALDAATLASDTTVIDLDADLFRNVFTINVIGYALMAKHAIPQMVARGGGVIVNLASVTGLAAEMERFMYGTTKSAIHGLTRNIATQHGKDGIRCVSVSPGVIVAPGIRELMSQQEIDEFTEHNALAREGLPEDVAAMVAFLASDDAAFVTGSDHVVDGGLLAHFPTVVDERRRLAARDTHQS